MQNIITIFVNANAQENDFILTVSDWTIVNRFRDFLYSFYEVTSELFGVYYPTSCLMIDYIWLTAESFARYRHDTLLGPIVAPMEVKFLKYFSSTSHLYCFATIFYPRNKLDGLKTAMEGIGEALDLDFSVAFNQVKDELFRVFNMYYKKYGTNEMESYVSEQAVQPSKGSVMAHLWKRMKDKESSFVISIVHNHKVES